MVASDYIIIPVQSESFALEGMAQLLKVISLVKSRLSNKLKVLGILLTMYNSNTRSSKEVLKEVKSYYKKEIFKTIIPRNVAITDSTMAGLPVVNYKKGASASKSYIELSKEIIRRLKV
ncbi:MAG: chromosome partitioning protein [Candidatus Micrarchaeota archaeon]|nr:MAG: chromosome partitioning protein [Candidatus Micrarchaeota archaeon]